MAAAASGTKRSRWLDAVALVFIWLLVFVVAWPSLGRLDVDGLDTAHHLVDGYFFRDLFHDHPHAHLGDYVLGYYRQYPALGFIFWPPLFPFVLGIFCLFGGAHVATARVCLLCFGFLFGASLYGVLRSRGFTRWVGFVTVAVIATVPGLAWSVNQIMLELPTLAMMCVAMLAYGWVVARLQQPSSVLRAAVCALALAAVIYTKQPGWFLYGALLFDLLLRHRAHWRKPELWWVAALTALFCLPLVAFTLKFGHADLAQSVGSNTRLIMQDYDSLPRWSWAAWSFYPSLAWRLLNPVVVVLAVAAMVLAVVRRGFFREHAVWFGWLAVGYLTFSYYDNRLPRHATFWWPAWVVLAAAAADALGQRLSPRWQWVAPALLLAWVPANLHQAWHRNYTDYLGERPAIAHAFADGSPGNLLIFGQDTQVWVALVREDDPDRLVHVVRGDSLLEEGETLAGACKRYRIGTVLVELPVGVPVSSRTELAPLDTGASFRPLSQDRFLRAGKPYALWRYHYTGAVDSRMAEAPLGRKLL